MISAQWFPSRSTNRKNYCAADKIISIGGEDEYRN
jgi:hypothetical protein